MQQLSSKKRFEEASLIRDKIRALDHLREVAIGLRDDVFNGNGILFKRIECYDISNIGESFSVGSMVVFVNGKPDKDQYRKFKIKISHKDGIAPKDDLSKLDQVLERRFSNDWPLPDLIVIDGGENQLRVAKDVLRRCGLDIPIISIAKGAQRKKNEFHFGNNMIAKIFFDNKTLSDVVITARDEAHRFAITYYRLLHQKDMINR